MRKNTIQTTFWHSITKRIVWCSKLKVFILIKGKGQIEVKAKRLKVNIKVIRVIAWMKKSALHIFLTQLKLIWNILTLTQGTNNSTLSILLKKADSTKLTNTWCYQMTEVFLFSLFCMKNKWYKLTFKFWDWLMSMVPHFDINNLICKCHSYDTDTQHCSVSLIPSCR